MQQGLEYSCVTNTIKAELRVQLDFIGLNLLYLTGM